MIMRQWLGGVTAMLSMSAVFASDITFFEHENFGGRRHTANGAVSNLADVGMNDRASSLSIQRGAWQVCTDADFRGQCVVLQRGDYPSLTPMGLNDRLSSAREVAANSGWNAAPGQWRDEGGVRVTLFEGPGFSGRFVEIEAERANLDGVFNDRTQSAIVHGGTWELCTDAYFGGQCQTFNAGRYPSLGGLANQISSARPVDYAMPRPGQPGAGWNRSGGATLYEGAHFSGRALMVDRVMPNLGSTSFNDRASSLRVERGYWMFCSDAHFEGECRTFGPGDYPTLPRGLQDRISSGRKISDEFPYRSGPAW